MIEQVPVAEVTEVVAAPEVVAEPVKPAKAAPVEKAAKPKLVQSESKEVAQDVQTMAEPKADTDTPDADDDADKPVRPRRPRGRPPKKVTPANES